MAWIRTIDEEDASGELQELYQELAGGRRGVDHILKIHGLNPPSLRGHHRLYRSLMFGPSDLSRAQRESIAVVVSAANDCFY